MGDKDLKIQYLIISHEGLIILSDCKLGEWKYFLQSQEPDCAERKLAFGEGVFVVHPCSRKFTRRRLAKSLVSINKFGILAIRLTSVSCLTRQRSRDLPRKLSFCDLKPLNLKTL